MNNRFVYIRYGETSVHKQQAFKVLFEAIERLSDTSLSQGRATALMMTALEEAYMWVGKAIRDDQMMSEMRGDPQLGQCDMPTQENKNTKEFTQRA